MRQQINAMKRRWPGFELAELTCDRAVWFGSLVGIERPYRVMLEFGLPLGQKAEPMWRLFPVVRILSPELELRPDALEEAPLPHVYFIPGNAVLSPLCLFDPTQTEWSHSHLLANTTVPWTAEWLTCYEIWLATGRWTGGGRYADQIIGEVSQ